ncbi:MAG TPA: hypothetical protein VFQ65_08555, partial [Kofleriaceae bacterium]|nr:hypothetical protein [Kofleriaceae bacterium]
LDRLRRHREWLWAPLLYAIVVAWIYRDLWHHHGLATGLGWDTIDTHGPDLDFFARDLREGRFSLWNPYDKGGYPVFCDPVFDRYYPLNWPFAAWGALFGTGWWLVQVKVLAHHVLAGALLHGFLRSRGLSIRAALVAGIGLVASAPLLTHKASNVLWPIVWVPLVWMAIDMALARPKWWRGALVGAALLPPLAAGSPPGVVYAALLILPYAGLRFVQRVRAHHTRAELVALAWTLVPAIVIALLVVAVTVLPASELVALGSRDRIGTGPSFALGGSLALPAALRGVFVRGAGPFEVYCGAAVVVLAAIGVALRPRADRDAPIAFAATALFGVILAAGTTALVLPVLVHHVPPFALLRVPGRYKLLCAWALAAGAGYGVAALEAAVSDAVLRKRAWIVAAAAVAVTIACVAIAGAPATVKDHPAWWSIVATAVAAGLAVAATRWPHVLWAVAVVVAIDAPLFTFVEPGAPVAAEPRQTHPHDADVLALLDGVSDRWRVYDEFMLGERAGARLRIRDFRGYPAIDPISLHRYVDVLEYAKTDPRILTDFNVRYVLVTPHWRYGTSTSFPHLPAPGFTASTARPGLFEADSPAPLIAVYGAVTVVPDSLPDHVLAAVRAVQDGELRQRAIVEASDAGALPPEASRGSPSFSAGRLESYEPDTIRFTVDTSSAGLVVLNELAFPGWYVMVDGVRMTDIRVNYLLRGVWVSAGHHEIVWQFSPLHWRFLVGGYAIAWLVILVALVYGARDRRRYEVLDRDPSERALLRDDRRVRTS